MPHRLTYAPAARDDLAAVRAWLRQPGSGITARRKLIAILAAINGLREHPLRYPVGLHAGARERPCAGGYRVIYEVGGEGHGTQGHVRVLRIFGPHQLRDRL